MSDHVGTHVDSPNHGSEGARSVDQIPLEALHGPAAVVDISERCEPGTDATIGVADLENWETKHGAIPHGAFVVMNSGWGRFWGNTQSYRGLSEDGKDNPHLPGFSIQATEWLLSNRDIRGLGSDTLSCDPGFARDFPTHRLLFENDKICVLNLANVHLLPPSGGELFVMPLKIRGGSGAPTRAFAIVNN